ncbi:MAG: glycosyltransferase [Acidobacteriota bacterium]
MIRLAHVSTFPPAQCGIGNYSQELVHALARAAGDVEVVVLAEREPGVADTANVRRVWDRRGRWDEELLRAIVQVQPDVVHFQHEQAFFGSDPRFDHLCGALRARGIHPVLTMHSVPLGRKAAALHRRLGAAADRIVVHQRAGMATALAEQGVPAERVAIIAHGTPEWELPDRAAARQRLELPADVPLALFFGFIHTGKRVHTALSAFEQTARALPGARLVVVGRIREDNVFQRIYSRWLQQRLARGVASGRVVFRSGFVPPEHKPAYFAAADLVVLPHVQAYGSASGVLHEAIASRRAFLCTRGDKFAEAVDALARELPEAFPRAGDHAAWVRGFEALLGSPDTRARMSELTVGLGKATSWTASAERHAALYRELAGRDRVRDAS